MKTPKLFNPYNLTREQLAELVAAAKLHGWTLGCGFPDDVTEPPKITPEIKE